MGGGGGETANSVTEEDGRPEPGSHDSPLGALLSPSSQTLPWRRLLGGQGQFQDKGGSAGGRAAGGEGGRPQRPQLILSPPKAPTQTAQTDGSSSISPSPLIGNRAWWAVSDSPCPQTGNICPRHRSASQPRSARSRGAYPAQPGGRGFLGGAPAGRGLQAPRSDPSASWSPSLMVLTSAVPPPAAMPKGARAVLDLQPPPCPVHGLYLHPLPLRTVCPIPSRLSPGQCLSL